MSCTAESPAKRRQKRPQSAPGRTRGDSKARDDSKAAYAGPDRSVQHMRSPGERTHVRMVSLERLRNKFEEESLGGGPARPQLQRSRSAAQVIKSPVPSASDAGGMAPPPAAAANDPRRPQRRRSRSAVQLTGRSPEATPAVQSMQGAVGREPAAAATAATPAEAPPPSEGRNAPRAASLPASKRRGGAESAPCAARKKAAATSQWGLPARSPTERLTLGARAPPARKLPAQAKQAKPTSVASQLRMAFAELRGGDLHNSFMIDQEQHSV